MRIRLITLLAVFFVMAPATVAAAAIVPPGNSAATQYSETLPTAGGEEVRHKGGAEEPSVGKGAGGEESTVPASTAAKLEMLGPEGKAALKLAKAGAPRRLSRNRTRPATKKKHEEKGGATAASSGTPAGPSSGGGGSSGSGGSSGVGEVLGGAAGTSIGGLGFLQPLIILAALLAAAAYGLRRRHGDADDHAGSPRR